MMLMVVVSGIGDLGDKDFNDVDNDEGKVGE